MPVDSKHPEYVDHELEWEMMRDCARGETAVKTRAQRMWRNMPVAVATTRPVENAGVGDGLPDDPGRVAVVVVGAQRRLHVVSEYLPMPDGFRFQPDNGWYMYMQYMLRAQFPEILTPTIAGMVGLIHRTEATIKLPDQLLPLHERCSEDGLSLEAFHKRVTRELLTTGRYSILPDFPESGGDLPYLAGYTAESLINWSEDGTLFVLDESSLTQDGGDEFEWVETKRYRVLRLKDGTYTQQVYSGDRETDAVTPTRPGGKALDFVPLVTGSAIDTTVCPGTPPLVGVARACLALFRLDADYRHQLYNTGQETLVITGAEEAPSALGSGVVVNLPINATAAYVSPKGVGISAHRQAIRDERDNAVAAGAKLFDNDKEGVESGEALRIRFAAQGATLVSVALTGAQILERSLKASAVMVGADPDEVVVTPNLDFVDAALTPKDAMELVHAWQADAISFQTLYENLQRGGVASVERTSDEEQQLIQGGSPPPSRGPSPRPPGLGRAPLVERLTSDDPSRGQLR